MINIGFIIFFRKRILRDEAFLYWKEVYPHTYRSILIISGLFSFKFVRMFYSRFFGFDNFCCGYTRNGTFLNPIYLTSIVNTILNIIPILIMSLIGLIAASWGTQFYITCIEAFLFLITLVVLTIVEFKTAQMYGYNKIIDPDAFSDVNAIPTDKDELERRLRLEALKRIKHYSYWNDFFKKNGKDEE